MIELERVNLSGKQLLVIVIVWGYSNGTMYLDSTVSFYRALLQMLSHKISFMFIWVPVLWIIETFKFPCVPWSCAFEVAGEGLDLGVSDSKSSASKSSILLSTHQTLWESLPFPQMPGGPVKWSTSLFYTIGLLFQTAFDTAKFLLAKECDSPLGFSVTRSGLSC